MKSFFKSSIDKMFAFPNVHMHYLLINPDFEFLTPLTLSKQTKFNPGFASRSPCIMILWEFLWYSKWFDN